MLAGLLVVVILQGQSYRTGVGPVPSKARVRKACIELLGDVAPENIIELGSGWGGMTSMLAKAFPDAFVTGYEQSLLPLWCSRMAHFGRPKIRTINTSFFDIDLTTADIMFCYLSPWHMQQLASKFDRELKSGALVVSAAFPLIGRTPLKQALSKGVIDIPVYLYRW